MARVTNKTFAERLLRSAEQAAAIKRGEGKAAKISRREFTALKVTVTPPPKYEAEHIVRIRQQVLGASQPVFAEMLNVSPSTVKAWERGARAPDGPTLRLLELAEKHPEVLKEAVGVKGSEAA